MPYIAIANSSQAEKLRAQTPAKMHSKWQKCTGKKQTMRALVFGCYKCPRGTPGTTTRRPRRQQVSGAKRIVSIMCFRCPFQPRP